MLTEELLLVHNRGMEKKMIEHYKDTKKSEFRFIRNRWNKHNPPFGPWGGGGPGGKKGERGERSKHHREHQHHHHHRHHLAGAEY